MFKHRKKQTCIHTQTHTDFHLFSHAGGFQSHDKKGKSLRATHFPPHGPHGRAGQRQTPEGGLESCSPHIFLHSPWAAPSSPGLPMQQCPVTAGLGTVSLCESELSEGRRQPRHMQRMCKNKRERLLAALPTGLGLTQVLLRNKHLPSNFKGSSITSRALETATCHLPRLS